VIRDVVLPRRMTRPGVSARVGGGVLTVLAGVAGALLALPASWSDYADRYPGFRLGLTWQTPYPLMAPVLIAVLAVAGLVTALRPATARAAAMVAGLAGLQVAGIAVVVHRDWWNYAGADGPSYHRAAAGSRIAMIMAAVAVMAVVVSVVLYRTGRGSHRPRPAPAAGAAGAGVLVAVGVPLLLCAYWHSPSVSAAGQFALWWSLPWGVGLAAAGAVPDPGARRVAALSVLASVLLAAFCVVAPTVYGFGLRLPD
jgi:hypothetical protein